ncbi:Pectinesterase [Quillaja saponaria]|uniref:pectinesterase n=1 Tax=Quillaja saponaria TaxID=32244 RepID=A0AAD7LYS3_QUISA|nr:Pectinesterase [Quillaja saponaria]
MCTFLSNSEPVLIIRVDQSGNGDYRNIQDAIDAVPSNNKELVYIKVMPGIYKEKIVVPADKPFIILTARYLTIQNTYGAGAKAVALRVSGDRVTFSGCRILSHQDTLLDDTGRHYYVNCYIEGETDFICGNAASLFEKCHLHSVSQQGGAITAQRRVSADEDTGFTFVNCKITGVKSAVLGRPWGSYSKVVFAFSYMSNVILPQGWEDWRDSAKQSSVYYGEYKCYGPGAATKRRVEWSHSLSAQQAQPFLSKNLIDGQRWIRPAPTSNVGGH